MTNNDPAMFAVGEEVSACQVHCKAMERAVIVEIVKKFIGHMRETKKNKIIIGPLYWVRFVSNGVLVPRWHNELQALPDKVIKKVV